jgi:Ca-activated chloride channel homolog
VTLLGLPLETLAILFGAAGAVVTVLYILKLRRRKVHVPFAKLWARVIRERESTSLFKHLRRLLSLLVQLFFLGLVAFALGDPRLSAVVVEGRSIVVLLDTSASMKARDIQEGGGGGTRMAAALARARAIVRGMGGADSLMLVRMDAQVTPLGPFSSDEKALTLSLEGVEASDTRGDLVRALRFAADALRGRKNPLLVLVTDGAYPKEELDAVLLDGKSGREVAGAAPPPAAAKAKGTGAKGAKGTRGAGSASAGAGELDRVDLRGVEVRASLVGRQAGNLGIVAFNARRYARNKLSFEIFLEVMNYFEGTQEVDLHLLVDDQLVEVKRLKLGPSERARYTCDPDLKERKSSWCNLAASGELLEARLVRPGDVGETPRAIDPFPLDDRAVALLPRQRKQRILLVSRGNLYLEGALLLDENIELARVTPAAYDAAKARWADAIVFDGFYPEAAPDRHQLLLAPPDGARSPFTVAKRLPAPIVTEQDKNHPVMRWVTLKDVNISTSASFAAGPGVQVLASSFKDAVMVARVDGARRSVAFGFDVTRSDLPLRVAFPLLVVNSLGWFAGEGEGAEATFRSGETFELSVVDAAGAAPAGERVELRGPDGRPIPAQAREGRVTVYGGQVGVYTAIAGAVRARAAVNLADARESKIAPARPFALGGRALEPPQGFGLSLRREIWVYLLLVALGITLVEWLTYNRRVTV